MPELPEVETVVRDLAACGLAGLRIAGARVLWPKTIATPAPPQFVRKIRGLEILGLSRRGKFVGIPLSGGLTLLIHLRMTGRLEAGPPRARPSARRHDRVVFALSDGRELRFADPRKFGRVWLTRNPAAVLGRLGPEPLGLTAAPFAAGVAARSRQLKPLLLDQHFIAGIGNIYADEALWTAQLHPRRKADSLARSEATALLRAIKLVLQRGIRNLGTTLGAGTTHFARPRGARGRNQEQLAAYGQTGQPCPRCGTIIERILVGQRATHVCPQCQRLAKRQRARGLKKRPALPGPAATVPRRGTLTSRG